MSTFVVRFVEERLGTCRGRIRHVASGEEAGFADERGLLAFIDRMRFLGALVRDRAELPDPDPANETTERAAAPAARTRQGSRTGRRHPPAER